MEGLPSAKRQNRIPFTNVTKKTAPAQTARARTSGGGGKSARARQPTCSSPSAQLSLRTWRRPLLPPPPPLASVCPWCFPARPPPRHPPRSLRDADPVVRYALNPNP